MAALNKRWVGTTSSTVYTLLTNWAPISLRNSTYRWLLSGSGTTNYYLDLLGGGNPGISDPGTTSGAITGNDLAFANGTAGALTASQFGYGDADTLGYNTPYVRLADSTDPDSKTIDWVKLYQVPVATDHVRIPAGSGAITGVDQSTVALGDFIVEDGYSGAIGTATLPLRIDPDKFEFSGTGTAYIDLFTAAIDVEVKKANSPSGGLAGLYLTGSAIDELTVAAGTVGLAMIHGQTATAAQVRVNGDSAKLYVGKGVTLTTAELIKGNLWLRCAATTVNTFGGKLITEEAGAITTLNADGTAECVLNSTGTITTLNMVAGFRGLVDFLQSAEARTVTTLNHNSGRLRTDATFITTTTRVFPTKPVEIAVNIAG